ncbi:nucleoside 2-deoxyribosyltransferase domain-containing protein [Pedobacter fastidiosus]|uniref:nucleoside 2-deoxyribosyltransferase domain-containing protein n=1 Tax=Pedobacter fastidiosus TaxID=2765361 RepID=UPI001C9BA3C8|nr:nucleoside 2-deoxyribosyltransferase domain-containing protein [Pedobacter fastidiosus]
MTAEKALSGLNIFNLRRKDWDNSWTQSIDNEQFCEQVNWELDAMEKADIILLFLSGESKSPISMMELGLFADSGKLMVCCEAGFWRKGNIDIVCKRKGIPQFQILSDLTSAVISDLNSRVIR